MLILLVEDNTLTFTAMQALFALEGHQTVHAKEGQEALDLLQRHLPDVIVLDLCMPVMDGLEFLERLRVDPAYRRLLVVVVTAISTMELDTIHEKLQALGPVQVLRKPFLPAELLALFPG